MKKIITILMCFASIHSFAQDVRGSRGVFGTLYIGNNSSYGRLVDTITNDTSRFNLYSRSIPTAAAVYNFVNGRMGGGGGTSTWDAVLSNGGTFMQNHNVAMGAHDLTFTAGSRGYTYFGSSTSPAFEAYYDNVSGQSASVSIHPGSAALYASTSMNYLLMSSNVAGTVHSASFHVGNSDYHFKGDSLLLEPYLGKINIDSLRTGTSDDEVMTWNAGMVRKIPGVKYNFTSIANGDMLRYSASGTEFVNVAYEAFTKTFTNTRWTARVGSTTSSATPTINTDNVDIYKLTAQTAAITSFTTNLSGSPQDGDILEIQITGTATRAITWGSAFVSTTVILPTTTSSTTTLTVIFQYYTTSSYGNNKWHCTNYY